MDLDIQAALQSLHDGGEVVFVVDVKLIGADDVTNVRNLFERAYRAMFKEDSAIKVMKRSDETHGLLVMVLTKQGQTEDPTQ